MKDGCSQALEASLPCGFLRLDAADRVTLWNETMAGWTRIPAGVALGRGLAELFPEASEIHSLLSWVRRSGRPRVVSQVLHGYLLPIRLPPDWSAGFDQMQQEAQVVPLVEPAGHVEIVLLDVTAEAGGRQQVRALHAELRLARQAAERAVHEREQLYAANVSREERYRSMVDSLREIVFQTNQSGRWTFLNPVWMEITGYPVEETLGTHFLEYVHPADQDRKLAVVRRVEERAVDHGRFEVRYRTPDGDYLWFEELIQQAFDRQGRPIGFSGTLNDITVRKQTEEQLRESETRFRQLAENIQEVFWMTNPARTEVLYVSPAYERVWGRSCQSLYVNPASWHEAIHPDDRTRVLELAQSRRDGSSHREVYRVIRPDQTERWVLDAGFPVRNDQGDVFRVVGVAQDITDQRHVEAALVEARDAAEAASRAKSEFLAKMSHEIRTPLNGLLGFAELLADSNLDERQHEAANIIRESGSALLAIINDILDFSKIEAGRLEIEKVAFDPEPILAGVVKLFEAAVRKQGLVLQRVSSAPAGLRLVGDVGRFRQVLTNLVGNAVKFTDRGGVTVALVAVEPPTTDKGSASTIGPAVVRLSVTDTGIGISPEKHALLFQEFSQVDGSSTRKFGGTGLGLAICKRLVELMGGMIGCESAAGQGSTFWFTLPVAESSTPVDAGFVESVGVPNAVPASAVAPSPARPPARQWRVLVAEDNRTNQLLATRMLTKLGCEVDLAANGLEAVQRAKTGAYDLVFMDCHMPELDGYGATQAIRRVDGAVSRVPILALTASVFLEDRQQCLDAGMNDFLPKPIDKEQLRQAVDHWCRRSEHESLNPKTCCE